MLCDHLGRPLLYLAMLGSLYSQQPGGWRDPSPHTIRFVTVDKDVQLEVLDWGGTGRPVVLLAGGGNTAHVFDEFATKLTTGFHIVGITRRGFGRSGFSPVENGVDQLQDDDVLTVIDALKLNKPVLVGHSIAGAELSSVGTLHPDRVAGLIYLEAGYPYAFDNGKGPTMKEFQIAGPQPRSPSGSDLASFSALRKWDSQVYGFRMPEAEFRQTWDTTADGRPGKARDFPGSQALMAIMSDTKKFTDIRVPALVIFAIPNVQESSIKNSTDSGVHETAKAYYTKLNALKEKNKRRRLRVVCLPRV